MKKMNIQLLIVNINRNSYVCIVSMYFYIDPARISISISITYYILYVVLVLVLVLELRDSYVLVRNVRTYYFFY